MSEPTSGIRRCDGRDGCSHGRLEVLQRGRRLRPQQRFDFRPTCLDRGQVRCIGRKRAQASSRQCNRLCDASDCVGWEMSHDDHRPWAELRDQHLVEKGPKAVALGAAFDGHRGPHALPPQGAQPRAVPAPIDRLRRVGALAPGGTRLVTCQGRMAPGLVKKAPGFGGYLWQDVAKVNAWVLKVGALLRDGVERVFGEAS
jgi:hypothetical protein